MNWLTFFLEFSAGVMGDTSSPAGPASKKPRTEEPSPSKLEKEREDFARKMLEEEMKKTPQSEASEVAKKCLLFQFLTGCVVF